MSSASILAVIDFAPHLDSANGFAPRAYHFLRAVAERWPLDVFAIDRGKGPDGEGWSLPPEITVRNFRRELIGPNPLYIAGLKGKMRRSVHYAFGKRSAMAYPERLPALAEQVAASSPALVIFFLPFVAHLSLGLSLSLPRIYVLEEGLERSYSWVAPPMPAWKRRRMDSTEQGHARRLYRGVAQTQGNVVAISEKEKQWFSRFIPADRICVLPLGIDCDFYRPAAADCAQEEIDVAVFGNMDHRRTYEPALELFSFIASHRPDLHRLKWAFIGSRPCAAMEALRSERVEVSGFVPDVRPYYERAKTVVVPSRHGGGVKTTLLQGWAMGCPVVATPFAVSGVPAVAGENVLAGESPAELADQIARLLASPVLRAQVGAAGRATVCAQRDVRVVADGFAQLCARTIGAEVNA